MRWFAGQAGACGRGRMARRQQGRTLLEMIIVAAIAITVAAIALPNFIDAIANLRLRTSASSVAGLLQQARLRAIHDNTYVTVRATTTASGAPIAYIDLGGSGSSTDGSGNGSYDAGSSTVTPEPVAQLSGTTSFAQTGAPTFNPVTLLGSCSGCTTTGDAPLHVSFNSRGLPCKMSGSVCVNVVVSGGSSTPVSFVYFLTDSRPQFGWAAVSVSPAGRIKTWYYDGAGWK